MIHIYHNGFGLLGSPERDSLFQNKKKCRKFQSNYQTNRNKSSLFNYISAFERSIFIIIVKIIKGKLYAILILLEKWQIGNVRRIAGRVAVMSNEISGNRANTHGSCLLLLCSLNPLIWRSRQMAMLVFFNKKDNKYCNFFLLN